MTTSDRHVGDVAAPAAARPRRTADVRGALVEAAEQVLEAHGVAGLTVRAVAKAAGVAPMGVYNHFESKDGLLLAVMARSFDRLAEATTWPSNVDPTEAMRQVGRGYRRFALDHPVAYGLMFGVGTRLPEAVERIADHQQAAFARIIDAVSAAQAAGSVRAADPQDVAMTIWAAVHGAIALESAGAVPDGFAATPAYESVLDLIERGLRPEVPGDGV